MDRQPIRKKKETHTQKTNKQWNLNMERGRESVWSEMFEWWYTGRCVSLIYLKQMIKSEGKDEGYVISSVSSNDEIVG